MSLNRQGFRAKLRQAKTIGADRSFTLRLVVVGCACFVQNEKWMEIGWQLMSQKAPFERYDSLTSPSSNYRRCRTKELKYPTLLGHQCKHGFWQPCLSDNSRSFTTELRTLDTAHRRKLYAVGTSTDWLPEGRPRRAGRVVSSGRATGAPAWQDNVPRQCRSLLHEALVTRETVTR